MPPPRPRLLLLSFSAPESRVTVSLAGSNGGGPKSCGGGGCDEEEAEAETIRSELLRRRGGRGRASETETATAAAKEAAGGQCGRRRAALRPATRKLSLPVFHPPEVDAATPLRARAAASGMGRDGRAQVGEESAREIEEGRASDEAKKRRVVIRLFSLSLALRRATRLALPPGQRAGSS